MAIPLPCGRVCQGSEVISETNLRGDSIMKWIALFFAAIFASSPVFAQSSQTYCHFVGSNILQCNSPQGLPPVPQTIPSSPPGPILGPLTFPRPYNQPSTGSGPPASVQPRLRRLSEVTPRSPPSQTDLKSAYCFGVITQQIDAEHAYMEQILRGASTDVRGETEATAREVDRGKNVRLQRLKRYIFPTLPYVDNDMLLAATQQGKVDVENIAGETKACPQKCLQSNPSDLSELRDRTNCLMTCDEMSEAYRHTKICQSLAFLPY